MITSKIIYQGDLRTECTHLQSGKVIVTDAPCDNQGKGEAFSPTDLMATSMGACILTIMGIKTRDHSIDITGTRAEITKIMASDPRRVSKVVVEFFFPDKPYTPEEKQLVESVAGTSPVPLSLHPDLKQTIRFHWPE